MNAKEFAAQIKSEIDRCAAQGQNTVSTETLNALLKRFSGSSTEEPENVKIERIKAHFQSNLEIEKYNHSADLEMFKSVLQAGQNAIKSITLLNGGASIALLAFIGKLADSNAQSIPLFAWPLTVFVFGVFIAAVTSGATYISQSLYAEDGARNRLWGKVFHATSITLGLVALSAFGYGTYLAYRAFTALGG